MLRTFMYVLNKNINTTYNNLDDFEMELQFLYGNQSNEINSLGPNLWISHEWE
jgi:hypothetical protein